MAVVPLPPQSTMRVWIDYTTGLSGKEHSVMLRGETSSEAVAMQVQGAFALVLLELADFNLNDGWQALRARWAGAGSTIELPLDLDPDLAAFRGDGPAGYDAERDAYELKWVGKSPVSGRRCAFSLYGVRGNLSLGNFRYRAGTEGFEGAVARVVEVLNFPTVPFRAIDGTKPIWYPYVNIGVNDYWERQIRRAG